MNEQDVRDLLENSARTPAPQTRVDVLAAVAVAERRARLRALAPAAASMLVVCGLVGGTVFGVNGLDRSPPATDPSPSAASTTPAAPTASTAPVVSAPKRFDPLVAFASFGWLPETEKPPEQYTTITADLITLSAADMIPDPANGPYARVRGVFATVANVYAAGVAPQTDGTLETHAPGGSPQTVPFGPKTEAPSVNGQPAQWVGVPGSERALLRWRYAPEAWAELHLSEMKGGDTREVAHRVASSLRIGSTERLRFPFHVTGTPDAVAPVSAEVYSPDHPWLATLSFGGRSAGEEPTLHVVVKNKAMAEAENNMGEPNTTVDGRPARRDTGEGEDHLGKPYHSDRLVVFDVDGVQVEVHINASSAAQARALWPDGAMTVYRNLTVHADPANWTDQPLR